MKYTSQAKQLTIDDFKSSLEGLSKSNRWVQLGDSLPWAKIEKLYNSRLNNSKKGAGNKPARMIIGSIIIQKKLALSDIETIQMIHQVSKDLVEEIRKKYEDWKSQKNII